MAQSRGQISIQDVCAFLEDQSQSSTEVLVPQPQLLGQSPGHQQESGAVATAEATGNEAGMSHICSWPGCGKGFSSRWSLERHARNHQPAVAGEQEPKPDSFVERRLRERLKSVQQALEKAKEKLAQQARQQEQADAELQEAREQRQQQQAEMQMLAEQCQRLVERRGGGFPQS